jgi:DedD protein
MGLLSLFRRRNLDSPVGQRAFALSDPAELERLRVRTRRRLVGAAVLVLLAVVLLPALLDVAPRPVGGDIRIEMPRRDAVVPPVPAPDPAASTAAASAASVQGAAVAIAPVNEPAQAVQGVPSDREEVTRSGAAGVDRVQADPQRADRQRAERERQAKEAIAKEKAVQERVAQEKAAKEKAAKEKAAKEKAARERADREKAEREKADRDKAKAREAATASRHWVQVGAYSEAATVRSVRQKIDKLGLNSVEQPVDTSAGPRMRVRLGPFASRDEAERVLARLKAGGLNGSVISP